MIKSRFDTTKTRCRPIWICDTAISSGLSYKIGIFFSKLTKDIAWTLSFLVRLASYSACHISMGVKGRCSAKSSEYR